MKKSRFPEEAIVQILKEVELGERLERSAAVTAALRRPLSIV